MLRVLSQLLPSQLVLLDVKSLIELGDQQLDVTDLPEVLLAERLQLGRSDLVVRIIYAEDELLIEESLYGRSG